MDQLTMDLLPPVAGDNHGQGTAAAVHFAQDFVRNYEVKPYAGIMGTEVSYFAQNGLLPAFGTQ